MASFAGSPGDVRSGDVIAVSESSEDRGATRKPENGAPEDRGGEPNGTTIYVSSGDDAPVLEQETNESSREKLLKEIEVQFQVLNDILRGRSIGFRAVLGPFHRLLESLNRYIQLCTLSQFVGASMFETYRTVIPGTLNWLLRNEVTTEEEFRGGNHLLPLVGKYLARLICVRSYMERERELVKKQENGGQSPSFSKSNNVSPALDQSHLEAAVVQYAAIARVCFTLGFNFYIPVDLEGGGKHMMSDMLVNTYVRLGGLRNVVNIVNHVSLYAGALLITSICRLTVIPANKGQAPRWVIDSHGEPVYPIRDPRELEPVNDIICDRLLNLSDDELKSEDNETLTTLLWSSAKMGTKLFPNVNFLKKHVAFVRKCLNSAVLEKRLFAIKYLSRYCVLDSYREADGYCQGVQIQAQELVQYVKDEHILSSIFGESMHTEILKKSNDLVQYIAFNGGIAPRDLEMMWGAIDGKRDDEIALMYRLIAISLRVPLSVQSTFSFRLLSFLVENLIMRGDHSRFVKSSFLKFIGDLETLVVTTKNVSLSNQGFKCRALFLNLVWYFLEQNDARLNEVFDDTMVQLIAAGFVDMGNLYQHMKRTLVALEEETIAPDSGMKILEALLQEGSYSLCSSDNPTTVELRAASSEIIRTINTAMNLFQIAFNGIKKASGRAKYPEEVARAFLHGIHTFMERSDYTLSRQNLADLWAYLSAKDLDYLMKYLQSFVLNKDVYIEQPTDETIAYVFDTLVSKLPVNGFTVQAFKSFRCLFFERNNTVITVQSDDKQGNRPFMTFVLNVNDVVGIDKVWEIYLLAVDDDLVRETKFFLIQLYNCRSRVGYLSSRKSLISAAFEQIETFSGKNTVEDESKVVRLLSLLRQYVKSVAKECGTTRYAHGVYQKWFPIKIKLVLKFENDFVPSGDTMSWQFVPIDALNLELIGSFVQRSLELLRKNPEKYGQLDNVDAVVRYGNNDKTASSNHLVQDVVQRNRMSSDGNHFLVSLFLCEKSPVYPSVIATESTKEGHDHVEDSSNMEHQPGTIMSRSPFFGCLYKMLGHCSQRVAESCSDLIGLLPTGSGVLKQLRSPKTVDWSAFLDFNEMVPSQLHYRLLGIWRFISTAEYNTPNVPSIFLKQSGQLDLAAIDRWKAEFLAEGGIEMLEKIFCLSKNRSSKFHQYVLWLSAHIFVIYIRDMQKFQRVKPEYYEEKHLLGLVQQYVRCVRVYGVEEKFSANCEKIVINCMKGMKQIFCVSAIDLGKLNKACGRKEFVEFLKVLQNGTSPRIQNNVFLCVKIIGEKSDLGGKKQLYEMLMSEFENVDKKSPSCLHFFLALKEIHNTSFRTENANSLRKFIYSLETLRASACSPQYVHGMLLVIQAFITMVKDKSFHLLCEYDMLNRLTETLLQKCLFDFSGGNLCRTSGSRSIAYRLLHQILISESPNGENLMRLKQKICLTASSLVPQGLENAPVTQWAYTVGQDKRGASGAEFAGLDNQGLTCYINSLIQQFFMVKKFRDGVLLSQPISNEDVDGVKYGTQLQSLLFELKKMFWFLMSTKRKSYDPVSFVNACRNKPDGFFMLDSPVFDQNDACEFFSIFADKIECALKYAGVTIEQQKISDPEKKKKTVGADFNLVRECFAGEFAHQIVLLDGPEQRIKERTEAFYHLQLTVKGQEHLQGSFEHMIVDEMLEGENAYYDEDSESKVRAIKRLRIKSLPPTLILHLKRFELNYDTFQKVKLNDYYKFPIELDMRPYMTNTQDESMVTNYRLCGVIVHSGTANAGHYYSFSKDRSAQNSWYEFNDDIVEPFELSRLAEECYGGYFVQSFKGSGGKQNIRLPIEKNAFMLFYERVDNITNEGATRDARSAFATEQRLKKKRMHQKPLAAALSNDQAPEPNISTAVLGEVNLDNVEFCKLCTLFDEQFGHFMSHCKGRGTSTLEMFKAAVNYFFNIFLHAKHNEDSNLGAVLMKSLRETIKESRECNEYLMGLLCEERYIEIHLLRCSVRASRQLLAKLIACSVVTYLSYPNYAFLPADTVRRPPGEEHESIPLINFVDARFNNAENDDSAEFSDNGSDEEFVLGANYSDENDSWEDTQNAYDEGVEEGNSEVSKPKIAGDVGKSAPRENGDEPELDDSAASDCAVDDSAASDSASDESAVEEPSAGRVTEDDSQSKGGDGEDSNASAADKTFKRAPEDIEKLKQSRSVVGNFVAQYVTCLEFASQHCWKNFDEYFECLAYILQSPEVPVMKQIELLNIVNSQHVLIRCINITLNEEAPDVDEGSNLVKLPRMESRVHDMEANLVPIFELISVLTRKMRLPEIEYPPDSLEWLKIGTFLIIFSDMAAEEIYLHYFMNENMRFVFDPAWNQNCLIQMAVALSEDGYYWDLNAGEYIICRLLHTIEGLDIASSVIGSFLLLWNILRIEDKYSDKRARRIVGSMEPLTNPNVGSLLSCLLKENRGILMDDLEAGTVCEDLHHALFMFCRTISLENDSILDLFCSAAILDGSIHLAVETFLPEEIARSNGLLDPDESEGGGAEKSLNLHHSV